MKPLLKIKMKRCKLWFPKLHYVTDSNNKHCTGLGNKSTDFIL